MVYATAPRAKSPIKDGPVGGLTSCYVASSLSPIGSRWGVISESLGQNGAGYG